MRVPLSDPVREFREREREIMSGVRDVLSSGQYILGEALERFEQEFAGRVGSRFAVGVASGTDAVELALEGLGVGPGDEVITTPFTFLATATAILSTGATPVFADVHPDTFLIDPEAAADAVTERTAAIVPVHLFGQMADLASLTELAERRGLALVEDAAQAFGASQSWRPGLEVRAGAMGDAGSFSFYPTKSLGAGGDGGIITTNDEDLAARLRRLRNHGRTPHGTHAEPGHNSRLDPVQAAFLSAKLPAVDGWTERRRAHAAAYEEALAESPGLVPPVTADRNRHIFHQYVLLCHDRDRVVAALDDADVAWATFYDPPVHRLEALRNVGLRVGECPVADELATRVLSVPVFAHLTEEERDRVSSALVRSGSLQPR